MKKESSPIQKLKELFQNSKNFQKIYLKEFIQILENFKIQKIIIYILAKI